MGLSAKADVSGTFITPCWHSPNLSCNCDEHFHANSESFCTASFPPQTSISHHSGFCPKASSNIAILYLICVGKLSPEMQKHQWPPDPRTAPDQHGMVNCWVNSPAAHFSRRQKWTTLAYHSDLKNTNLFCLFLFPCLPLSVPSLLLLGNSCTGTQVLVSGFALNET